MADTVDDDVGLGEILEQLVLRQLPLEIICLVARRTLG